MSTDSNAHTPGCSCGADNLTEKQLAKRLNMSVKWLQKKRLEGGGITFRKMGSSVRYSLAAVLEFEAASLRASTSDTGRD